MTSNVVTVRSLPVVLILAAWLGWSVVRSVAAFSWDSLGIAGRVESSCFVNGLGVAQCTFHNLGWGPGAACTRVGLVNVATQARRGELVLCSGSLAARESRMSEGTLMSMPDLQGLCPAPMGQSWVDVCALETSAP